MTDRSITVIYHGMSLTVLYLSVQSQDNLWFHFKKMLYTLSNNISKLFIPPKKNEISVA